ncbi:UNVERIFIED_ORG: GGDEF domain-containing protein [Roseateles sp. XES5]|nr:sensor domain-containing diguanylate cyclase [Roseateles sp. XES5]
MRRNDRQGWPQESGVAHVDAILPLALIRDRAATDLILSGLDASGVAFALFSPDDVLSYGSTAFRTLFDVQPGARTFADIMRHCHATGIGPRVTMEIEAFLAMAGERRRSRPQRTFEIDVSDERWFLVNETLLPGGWLWHVFTDISMLKSNERVLQQARDAAQLAADTDPLTGLLSRRAAMERLDAEMQAAFREGAALSLVLIDLDHFKTINDRYGHARGDAVLRHFAAAGRQQLRGGDIFARIGGEEFMMLMPGAGMPEAVATAERLRSHIAGEENRAGLGCAYTMSAGVAQFCGTPAADFFERADRALYASKRSGRNRIERAD